MNILITGGLGKTARPILALLREAGHEVCIFDIAGGGDVRDYQAVSDAMRGMDAAIHLAVNAANPRDAALSFQTNVYGTYNLLRAAQENHVQKVLLASSAPVHLPPGAACDTGEDFTYDLTKHLQETTALHFAQTYGMNILALRLGHIVNGITQTDLHGVPLSDLAYCRGGWVCQYDVARAFHRAIEADFTGYHLVNIIGSHQAAARFDLSSAKELIGFECGERFLGYK